MKFKCFFFFLPEFKLIEHNNVKELDLGIHLPHSLYSNHKFITSHQNYSGYIATSRHLEIQSTIAHAYGNKDRNAKSRHFTRDDKSTRQLINI